VGILLPLTMSAYVVLSLAIGEAVPSLRAGWLEEVLADTAFLALWYWVLLGLAQRRERYQQTACALFGLQTVLAAPSIGSLWLTQWLSADKSLQSSAFDVVIVVALSSALLVWTLLATSHIVRAALERSMALCLILAFAQMLAEGILLESFNPGH